MAISYVEHTPQFATLGQISKAELRELKLAGFKSVINNRPDGEGGDDQPTTAKLQHEAKKLGLAYAYLPVISGQITPQQVADFKRLLATLPSPIVAFCRTGNRSTELFKLAHE